MAREHSRPASTARKTHRPVEPNADTCREESFPQLCARLAQFRALFNEMTEAFALHEVICDKTGKPVDYRFLDINPAFEQLTGFKRKDVIGKRVREILPEIESYWIDTYGEVALTGKPVHFENYSHELCRYYQVSAFRPAEKQFAVLFMDITNETRLRQELQVIVENTTAQIAYLDCDFRFIMVNSAYADDCGHPKEELIGRNHFDLFPNAENEEIFRSVRETGKAVEFKAKPFEYADQPWRGVTYWDWKLTPAKDEAGRGLGFVLSLVDVTENVRTGKMRESLNDINATINSSLDVDTIMRRVIAESTCAIGAECASIWLREDGFWQARYTHNLPKSFLGIRVRDTDVSFVREILKTHAPTPVEDTAHDPRTSPYITRRYGIKAALGLPLMIQDEPFGVLVFAYHRVQRFSPNQLDFARKLAASMSLALYNARLYEQVLESREAAVEQLLLLQRALLPQTPCISPDYLVATAYLPAYAGMEIGGDFYDVFSTEDGETGILIGDVSGKGLEATSSAVSARSTIRAFAFDTSSPQYALMHSNSLLIERKASESQAFVTACVVILDPESGEFRYASAGHPPPAILHRDRSVEFLSHGEPPLGLIPGHDFPESQAKLLPGDRLILYTDGLSEARRGFDLFWLDGIERVLTKHSELDPNGLVEALVKAARDWSQDRLRDDTVILIIERRG